MLDHQAGQQRRHLMDPVDCRVGKGRLVAEQIQAVKPPVRLDHHRKSVHMPHFFIPQTTIARMGNLFLAQPTDDERFLPCKTLQKLLVRVQPVVDRQIQLLHLGGDVQGLVAGREDIGHPVLLLKMDQ